MKTFIKDPNAVLDYVFDFAPKTNNRIGAKSDYLQTGETISSFTVTVGTGLTLDSSSLINTNTCVQVWLSGGTLDAVYQVLCRIITSHGRTDDRTIEVQIGNK